ncbi:MAG TPA: hypothetical protein VG895_03390 [Patescibacteria group bacterium]|nr:hypothetical protein [Patescibacteria group bacterium]
MTKHLSDYFSLGGILIATVIGFFAFSYNKDFQLAVVTASSFSYFVWGIIHHFIKKDLNLQILIEYAMFSLIGFVTLVAIIYRS